MKRPERVAAVEKIEEMRKPDDFFGHRNRAVLRNTTLFPVVTLDIILADNTASSAIGHCHSLSSLDPATGGGRIAPL